MPGSAEEIIRCPRCGQRLRVPGNRGTGVVTCGNPACRHRFEWSPAGKAPPQPAGRWKQCAIVGLFFVLVLICGGAIDLVQGRNPFRFVGVPSPDEKRWNEATDRMGTDLYWKRLEIDAEMNRMDPEREADVLGIPREQWRKQQKEQYYQEREQKWKLLRPRQ